MVETWHDYNADEIIDLATKSSLRDVSEETINANVGRKLRGLWRSYRNDKLERMAARGEISVGD